MDSRTNILINAAQGRIEKVEKYEPNYAPRYSQQISLVLNFLLQKNDISILESVENRGIDFLDWAINKKNDLWTIEDITIQQLIRPVSDSSIYKWIIGNFIKYKLTSYSELIEEEFNKYLNFFKKQGFKDTDICQILFSGGNTSVLFYFQDKIKQLSLYGKYLLQQLKATKTEESQKLLEIVFQNAFGEYRNMKSHILDFLFTYHQESLENQYIKFMYRMDSVYDNSISAYRTVKKIEIENILYLIDKNATRFEQDVIEIMKDTHPESYSRFSVYIKMDEYIPNKYNDEIEQFINEYYTQQCLAKGQVYYNYLSESYTNGQPSSVAIAKWLLKKDENAAKERIRKYLEVSDFFYPEFPRFLSNHFGSDSLEFLVVALNKNPKYLQKNFHETVFSLIEQYDFSSIAPQIWEYAIHNATKNTRNLAANTLAKLGNESLETAKNLLQAKTADTRIVAALVLSKLKTVDSEQVLNAVLEVEKNDDTRDVILEALEESLFAHPISLTQAKTVIQNASKRSKLSKFSEKWIDEAQLPPIYWTNNQGALSKEEVRFLFYRMPRGKGLNSDIELRQLLPLIDRNQSGGFAKALLKAFADSGSNSKFKYYLTTGGMLGGDEALTTLKGIFKYNMDEKRYKMAEYAIDAMMQVGTNKALRSIEVISRKYVSKRPTVSDRAIKALDAAALELNITTDELADRIIPNFEFEGLFKSFVVDGDEYRAFVNSDFTLCYFDEDNKMRKSLPKSASTDLKKEFKEIEKEIRDVIKTQSGRLEKYMIEERRWSIGQWQAAFLESPIMFVYAMKLLWGIFNKENEFKEVFYCQEDTSLLNLDDDEIEFEEGDYISILHPIYLTQEQIKAWQSKVYELSILPVFSQLERKTFTPPTDELGLSYTRNFQNQDIPKGADYASSTIEKYGWIKSTGDGGHLELIKKHQIASIQANVEIEGVYAWYQGGNAKATVNNISFRGKSWNDTLSLKDIPPVFFSEVLFDIYRLINAV